MCADDRRCVNYELEKNVGSRISILVFDEDKQSGAILQRRLAHREHDVFYAADGHDFLRLVIKHRFDVVVASIPNPQMSAIIYILEAINICPRVVVCAVVRHVTPALTAELQELGVCHIMEHSAADDEMLAVIRECARKSTFPVMTSPVNPPPPVDHLKLVSSIDWTAAGKGKLVDVLHAYGCGLAAEVDGDMFGVLVFDGGSHDFIIRLHGKISRGFLDTVSDAVAGKYRELSGRSVGKGELVASLEGEGLGDDAPSGDGSMMLASLVSENDICGIAVLAAHESDMYDRRDISSFCHAVNHVVDVYMAMRRLHDLAAHDALTHLYNRRRMEEELEHAWQFTRRYELPMAVVIVDIDHFKDINDKFGHSVGDEVLRAFAGIIKQTKRAVDIAARFGGDEFLILMPCTTLDGAKAFCRRLLRRTRDFLFCAASHHLKITVSAGVAACDDTSTPGGTTGLLAMADQALYAAKRNGRDRMHSNPEK